MAVIDLSKNYSPLKRERGKCLEWFINMLNQRSPTLEDWMKFEEEMYESWVKNGSNNNS
jgi:hypothetical protein